MNSFNINKLGLSSYLSQNIERISYKKITNKLKRIISHYFN